MRDHARHQLSSWEIWQIPISPPDRAKAVKISEMQMVKVTYQLYQEYTHTPTLGPDQYNGLKGR